MEHTIVIVCAWCERYLGTSGEAARPGLISHGICPSCTVRQGWTESPTLVVSRSRQDLLPILRELLRGDPEIRVVVDRRTRERRSAQAWEPLPPERREGRDRRRGAPAVIP